MAVEQVSFKMVKDLLINSPALTLFDFALSTIVTTDASAYGQEAILNQIHDDNMQMTVAFASRTLTEAERKYSAVEKEALACIWDTEK